MKNVQSTIKSYKSFKFKAHGKNISQRISNTANNPSPRVESQEIFPLFPIVYASNKQLSASFKKDNPITKRILHIRKRISLMDLLKLGRNGKNTFVQGKN